MYFDRILNCNYLVNIECDEALIKSVNIQITHNTDKIRKYDKIRK